MAQKRNSVVECAKAATIACHSSTGWILQYRKEKNSQISDSNLVEASKLMRTAESLARSAAVLLVAGSQADKKNTAKVSNSSGQRSDTGFVAGSGGTTHGDGGVGGGGGVGGSPDAVGKAGAAARRRYRKKQQKKKEQLGDNMMTDEDVVPETPAHNMFQMFAELQKTLPSSLRQPGAASSDAGGLFALGTQVVVKDLTTNLDLNGASGSVVEDAGNNKGDGRLAIQIKSTGRKVRLQPKNLSLAPLQQPAQVWPDDSMFPDYADNMMGSVPDMF